MNSSLVFRAIIEPPADHPNKELVSGERIPAVVTIPGAFPWHLPWTGWTVTALVDDDELQDFGSLLVEAFQRGAKQGRNEAAERVRDVEQLRGVLTRIRDEAPINDSERTYWRMEIDSALVATKGD